MSLRIVNRQLVGHELDLRILDEMEGEQAVVTLLGEGPRVGEYDVGLTVSGRQLSGHEFELRRLDAMEGAEVRVDRVSYVRAGCPDDEEYEDGDFDLDDLDVGA